MSSGRPPAAIAVIRISGPAAIAAARTLAGSLPPPRQAAVRALQDHRGELLDRALVLMFPAPASTTGEDVVELHCHGGRAVVEAVENALYRLDGVRRAEPGEFTRRALLNGRIDLTEAEGLADLLDAETEMQRRAALAATEGQVSRAIRGWMDRVIDLAARVEALIDYAEDGDSGIEAISLAGLVADQHGLVDEIALVLGAPPVERWRDGFRIVVAGPPNAGKSTLINLLGGREAAIVSPVAGTTRDRIEVSVRRNGAGYILIDTAGLRNGVDDEIERIGMSRAREAMATADLLLWLSDTAPMAGDSAVWIHAKTDLPGRHRLPSGAAVGVSVRDPASIERLWALIEQRTVAQIGGNVVPLHEREWNACQRALEELRHPSEELLLVGERLRVVRSLLAEALGLDATEMMLDSLFSRFCLGK